MAGDALVVGGGDLTPQREPLLAGGGVPGAAGPGEVLRGARVVHRRRATGGCDHGLDPPHRRGDVEVGAVEVGDGRVHQLLQPVAQGVLAVDHEVALGLEPGDGLVDRRTRSDAGALGDHVGLDPSELVPPPLVGLGQVHLGPEEPARQHRVAVGSHRVGLGGGGGVGHAQVLGEVAVGHRRRHRGLVEVGAQGRAHALDAVGAAGQRLEERGLLPVAAPHRGLFGRFERLPAGGHDAAGPALLVGLAQPSEGGRHRLHPPGRDLPVRDGLVGHHVEHVAHGLHRAGQVVDLAERLVRVDQGQARAQPLGQVGRGQLVVAAPALERRQLDQCLAVERSPLVDALDREVGHAVVVPDHAQRRGQDGIERGGLVDVAVRQREHGRRIGVTFERSGVHPLIFAAL